MKRLWWLVWALWAAAEAAAALCDFNCNSSNCTCERSTGSYRFECNTNGKLVLTATLVPSNYIVIQCDSSDSRDLETLAGLRLCPVKILQFKLCPLPPVSYRRLMDSMGVTSADEILHDYFILQGKLNGSHLADLPFVSKLRFMGAGLGVLPEDLLSGVPALKTLDLQDNRLRRLPERLFQSTPELISLELGSNRMSIEDLAANPFSKLQRLKHLNLWANRFSNLTEAHLDHLPQLTSLDLNSNGLHRLEPTLFSRLANLSVINLSTNYLEELPVELFRANRRLDSFQMNHNGRPLALPGGGLFANFTDLKAVNLESSAVTSLPEDLFWGSVALRNVSLNNNNIPSVPARLFQDSWELHKVNLSGNLIEELPDALFAVTIKLHVLDLSGNRLKSISGTVFSRLTKLTDLRLARNQLKEIAPDAFLSLSKLLWASLEDNQIETFGTSPHNSYLKGSPELRYLNLSKNNVSIIFEDWIRSKPDLRTLDLSRNKLVKIKGEDMLRFLSSSLTVDLSHNLIEEVDFYDLEYFVSIKKSNVVDNHKLILVGNPFNCNCRLYWFIVYLKNGMNYTVYKELEITDVELLNCSGPESLKGEQVASVDLERVSCESDWKGCPAECSCSYWPHMKGFRFDCSARGVDTPPKNATPPPATQDQPINHTELNISSNFLSYWPDLSGPGYVNLTVLDLSRNQIDRIDANTLPSKIEELMLDNNRLTRIEGTNLKLLRASRTLRKLTLHNNSWTCDCEAANFLDFVHNAPQVSTGKSDIRCSEGNWGKPLPELTDAELCFVVRLVWGVVAAIAFLVALIIGVGFALYYRYHNEVRVWLFAHRLCLWLVTEEELDRNKTYDAFISYAHQDEDFVVNKLVPGLEQEGPTKFKLCLHFRDWVVGDFIPNQIARSVEESKRTIVVLSKSFVESVWGKMEFRTAHSQALSEGRARVIIILYGEVDTGAEMDPELKAYLSTNTYLKWGDPWFWDRLRYALPHPPKATPKKDSEENKKKKKKKKKEQSVQDKTALVEDETLVTLPAPGGRVLVDIRRTDPV